MQPAAKQGDRVVATDIHIVMIPSPGGPVPTPLPHPFIGALDGGLSADVFVEGKPAAVRGSTASNSPPHVPQGGPFQTPPKDRGEVMLASTTVYVNGESLARNGDVCLTCNDPADLPAGQVVAVGTVFVGG